MQISFTFRNFDSSDNLKAYATEKLGKLQRYLRSPLEADVVCATEKHLHCVEVSVRGDGETWHASVESENMYASVDLVADKLDRQLRRAKEAAHDRVRHSGGVAQLSGKLGPVPDTAPDPALDAALDDAE